MNFLEFFLIFRIVRHLYNCKIFKREDNGEINPPLLNKPINYFKSNPRQLINNILIIKCRAIMLRLSLKWFSLKGIETLKIKKIIFHADSSQKKMC